MSETFDSSDAQLAIDDALADLQRACRELQEDDEVAEMGENGLTSMSGSIMNCAKELTLTKFRLNSLEEIYRDAIQSIGAEGDKCTSQIRQRLIELDGQTNSTMNDSNIAGDTYDMNVDDEDEDTNNASQPTASTSTGRGGRRRSKQPKSQRNQQNTVAVDYTLLIDQIKTSIPSGGGTFENLSTRMQTQSVEPTEFPSLNSLKNILKIQRQRGRSQRQNNSSNDLEVLEDESENVLIDPISKKPIEHPVRNKKCKHIYDKSSILKFISSSSHPRCPNIGCANSTPLNRAAIEDVSLDDI